MWSIDFIKALGNDKPSTGIILLVLSWQQAEGSKASFNPLATTQNMDGATCFNADPCVKNYRSREDGIRATLITLSGDYPGYKAIIAGIQRNDPSLALRGIQVSPWGTHAALIAQVYNEQAALLKQQQSVKSISSTKCSNKSVVTRSMSISTGFYARGCTPGNTYAWQGQKDCMHWGIDFDCPDGCPVYAPFDMTIISLGYYDDAATEGEYIQGTLCDGYVLYLGHMRDRMPFTVGQFIRAGTPIGFTNKLDHTHAQLAPPGWTAPCAEAGACINFVEYYNTH